MLSRVGLLVQLILLEGQWNDDANLDIELRVLRLGD